jgi:uncharacterized protein (UPF0276 family)
LSVPIQYAINYSPQATALLDAGALHVDGQIALDRFKCPDWPDLVERARACLPVAVHFDLHAGQREATHFDRALIDRLLAETGTPAVNIHLHARAEDYPHIPIDSTDPAHVEEITAALLRDVRALVAAYGPERVIVENAPYYADRGKTLRASVEPDVIRWVVAEIGCGLLLDLSHAWMSAHYLRRERDGYVSALPLEALREVHVTGVHQRDGRLRDHLAMTEPDWHHFAWALGQIDAGAWATPWLVAFEYGGVGPNFEWRSESGVIAAQAPKMAALVHAIHPAPLTPEKGHA